MAYLWLAVFGQLDPAIPRGRWYRHQQEEQADQRRAQLRRVCFGQCFHHCLWEERLKDIWFSIKEVLASLRYE